VLPATPDRRSAYKYPVADVLTNEREAPKVSEAIRLLRPKQWSKGLLVFAALIFSRAFSDPTLVFKSAAAFFAIALVSSAVYVLNDLLDIERDRQHPVKRERPLASGRIGVSMAIALLVVCLAIGLGLGVWLGVASLGVVATYLVVQVGYNFGLKRQPVADVFSISLGFILRATLGAAAINVGISGWLLFCTGALALLIGFGKRRHEFVLQGEERVRSRESLQSYSLASLDAMLMVAAACAAMSYGIYSLDSATAHRYPALMLTSLFVVYGIYRYIYLILARNEGGEPETLLFKDPHIMATVVLFVLAAFFAMSGVRIPFLLTDDGASAPQIGRGA